MPRKYDRTIRYYDSWFDDLQDPSKEFTPAECWQIMLAIRDCQLSATLEPLYALPLSIRRALSMATMGEQIIRQLERAESMRNRSKKGGDEAAARRQDPERAAAAALREQQRELKIAAQDARMAIQKENSHGTADYITCLKLAAQGDKSMLDELRITREQAIKLCNQKKISI